MCEVTNTEAHEIFLKDEIIAKQIDVKPVQVEHYVMVFNELGVQDLVITEKDFVENLAIVVLDDVTTESLMVA